MCRRTNKASAGPRLNGVALALACVATAIAAPHALAQDMQTADPGGTAAEMELVQINWLAEMAQGGMTMVALAVLSVAMVAFAIERAVTVRRSRFCPPGLVNDVLPLVRERQYAKAIERCERQPSVLSDVISHLITHRKNDMRVVAEGAGDLAGREVADQQENTFPLAVIAALAPLLGLLGTMIGMIEAFKLVEVFGDEGGASMLAGSISKALITTAVGLTLAIPSLILFHFFRRRIHRHSIALEREADRLLNAMYLEAGPPMDRTGDSTTSAAAVNAAKQPQRHTAAHPPSEASVSDAPSLTAPTRSGGGTAATTGNAGPRKD